MSKVFKKAVSVLLVLPILFLIIGCDPPVRFVQWIKVNPAKPYKEVYNFGSALVPDVENLEIEVCYSNGDREFLPVAVDWVQGFSTATAGFHTLTIVYVDPNGGGTKTDDFEIEVLPQQVSTVSELHPVMYSFGKGMQMQHATLVERIAEKVVENDVDRDQSPANLAKVDVAMNIADTLMTLFFSNALGTALPYMGANGYSHGGTTAAATATMLANTPTQTGYARHLHTKESVPLTSEQVANMTSGGRDMVVDGDRPYMRWKDSASGKVYIEVTDENVGTKSYYIHHYYDDNDFRGYSTKLGVNSLFDTDNGGEVTVYHAELGFVRNREIFCNDECIYKPEDMGACSNPEHRLKYVPGYIDNLAKVVYDVLGNMGDLPPASLISNISSEAANVTFARFADYFYCRYTSEERENGMGGYNAETDLRKIFTSKLNTVGNIRNLYERRVSERTSGVKEDVESTVRRALNDVTNMILTVWTESPTRGRAMLEASRRQMFAPTFEQYYTIGDDNTFNFDNVGIQGSTEVEGLFPVEFVPYGSEKKSFILKFDLGSVNRVRPLTKIFRLGEGLPGVFINDFLDVNKVLAELGLWVYMMPR